MRILGHRTHSMLERYDIVDEEDLKQAAATVRPADSGKILALTPKAARQKKKGTP